MGRKLLLSIKVYLYMLVGGFVFSVVLSAGAVFYYFKSEPNVARAFKERIALDLKFTESWVNRHQTEDMKSRCRLLRQPYGYRCFYYNTFSELELRTLSFVGYMDLTWRGLLLVVKGDRSLADQPSTVGGTPSERFKTKQLKHWMSYVGPRIFNSFFRSEIVDGVRYVTGSLPNSTQGVSSGSGGNVIQQAVQNNPAMKALDLDKLKKTVNERNQAIKDLEKALEENP